MKLKNIKDYCKTNIYSEKWIEMKNIIDIKINCIIQQNPLLKNELFELEILLIEFINFSNEVLKNESFQDWFKIYVENQLSIYYYGYKETIENNFSHSRMIECQNETQLNELYTTKQMKAAIPQE